MVWYQGGATIGKLVTRHLYDPFGYRMCLILQFTERRFLSTLSCGPNQGQKASTIKTLPVTPPGEEEGPHVAFTGRISLHAGIAARAHQRAKLERLCGYVSPQWPPGGRPSPHMVFGGGRLSSSCCKRLPQNPRPSAFRSSASTGAPSSRVACVPPNAYSETMGMRWKGLRGVTGPWCQRRFPKHIATRIVSTPRKSGRTKTLGTNGQRFSTWSTPTVPACHHEQPGPRS